MITIVIMGCKFYLKGFGIFRRISVIGCISVFLVTPSDIMNNPKDFPLIALFSYIFMLKVVNASTKTYEVFTSTK